MDNVRPFPKSLQLARGRKRYPRKVASRKQWEALSEAKRGPCRICGQTNPPLLQLHHVVWREDFGDDVAANLVPLCADCHSGVHLREPAHCRLLVTRLTDAEYAYAIHKAGEDYFERAYGIEYDRG